MSSQNFILPKIFSQEGFFDQPLILVSEALLLSMTVWNRKFPYVPPWTKKIVLVRSPGKLKLIILGIFVPKKYNIMSTIY